MCYLEIGYTYRYVSVGSCMMDFDFLVLSGNTYSVRCRVLRKGRCDMRIADVGGISTLSRRDEPSHRVRYLLPPEEWSDEVCIAVAKYQLCEGS